MVNVIGIISIHTALLGSQNNMDLELTYVISFLHVRGNNLIDLQKFWLSIGFFTPRSGLTPHFLLITYNIPTLSISEVLNMIIFKEKFLLNYIAIKVFLLGI